MHDPSDEPLPYRVLVAEDHPVHQQFERTVLEGLGCDVTVVGDGAQALSAAREVPFDLIILDRNMPVCDGDSAAAQLRRNRLGDHPAPIVCCSTAPPEGAVAALYDHILTKPMNPSAVYQLLTDLAA